MIGFISAQTPRYLLQHLRFDTDASEIAASSAYCVATAKETMPAVTNRAPPPFSESRKWRGENGGEISKGG
jgi:hypothetical protein